MTRLAETDYFVARERAARELAQRATNPGIAIIHLDMADRYARLAEELRPTLRSRQTE